MLESIQTYMDGLNLDPLLTAGLIVLGSLTAAQVTALILSRVLARLASRTKTDADDEAIRILKKPIFMSVLLVGMFLAEDALDPGIRAKAVSLSLLKTIGILIWMGAIFRLTNLLFSPESMGRRNIRLVSNQTAPLFNNLIKISGVVGAIYLIISAWHVDPTAWLASAGIVGIAVGFAAKDTLSNVFAGVFILADAPYKVGDYINFETGERGEVTQIGLRSTRILTRDDIEITIPNAVIGNAKIVNETGGRWPRMRIRVPVGVAYGSDIDLVSRILTDTARANKEVCQDLEPLVRLRKFGDSSLDFELMVWIEEPPLRGRTIHFLLTDIYKRFAKEGVTIPFPQRDLWVKEMPKGS